MDVDPNGALVVRTEDGVLKKIYYGDCFHTSPQEIDTRTKTLFGSVSR